MCRSLPHRLIEDLNLGVDIPCHHHFGEVHESTRALPGAVRLFGMLSVMITGRPSSRSSVPFWIVSGSISYRLSLVPTLSFRRAANEADVITNATGRRCCPGLRPARRSANRGWRDPGRR